MSETVKRYNMDIGRFGNVDNYESEHGRWVLHTDYARLEQECERLRSEQGAETFLNLTGEIVKANAELQRMKDILREIAVGISKREMPTEQQLNKWFDRIDAALSAKP